MSSVNEAQIERAVKQYSSKGLTLTEAKSRLQQFGENTFVKEKLNAFKTLLKQFLNPLSFILIAAAGLSFFMGEYSDAVIIMTIVMLNSLLSFIQEFRSEKAVERLSKMIQRKVLVMRDGQQGYIDVKELVPGDTILLKGGDVVPANIKIMEAYNLFVNEAQLTGESISISKAGHLPDLESTVLFAGSVIEKGRCTGVVYATGNETELGRIAELSNHTKKDTPYKKSLAEFSFSLLRIIAASIVLMIAAKIPGLSGMGDFAEVILFAVALAMTVVPEALPMITTINLSNGALRLARRNVIVKRLSAVEDLGRIDVLCTDKTGTLTEDKLSVQKIIASDETLFQKLAYASIEDLHGNSREQLGSFDVAFTDYVSKTIKKQVRYWRQLEMLPFDPADRRRRMILQDGKGKQTYLVVIGSPESLLELSLPETREGYAELLAESGNKGMRQLGIAYKSIDPSQPFDILKQEEALTFLGFAELADPLRKTAKASIKMAEELGVAVKILTGDSVEVATYIGRDIGLLQEGDKVYSGEEIQDMTDPQLDEILKHCCVFARVTPEQKYHIISRLKQTHIVGYQGDGINDAPSLKLADVAVAVHNATDVAKESADIVLLEDDLGVIMKGIRYGRSIFVNINKYIKHAMIGNIGNFFSLAFFYVVFAVDLPMLPIQLLIANLIQDMPLMSIFSDSVEDEEVKQPQAISQVKSIMKTSLGLGAFTAVYYLLYFLFLGTEATALTQTNLFLFFNFTQLLIILSVRSKQFLWKGRRPSKLLLGSILLFVAGSVAMTYIPFIAGFMGFAPLPATEFITLTAVSVAFIILLDITKVGLNRWDAYRKQRQKAA